MDDVKEMTLSRLPKLYETILDRMAWLEIRGSNGSKCYHVFSFATGMLMR